MAAETAQQLRVYTGPLIFYPLGSDPVIVCGDRYAVVPLLGAGAQQQAAG